MTNFQFLDKEEKDLIASISPEGYQEVADQDLALSYYSDLAKTQLARKKAINIRLYESDVQKIKSKAIKEGIPYQTLISSVVHKFANQ